MNKLSFSQKNDLLVKHKSKKHFGKDLELFQKYCPSDRLMNDLGKATEFSFERLDGQMLYLLLDKVSIEEILKNRCEEREEMPVMQNANQDKGSVDVTRITAIIAMFIGSGIEITEDINNFISENPDISDDEVNAFISEILNKSSDFKNKNSNEDKLSKITSEIVDLNDRVNTNESELSDLRSEIDDKDALIEEIQSNIENLKNKPVDKKKDETGGIPINSME